MKILLREQRKRLTFRTVCLPTMHAHISACTVEFPVVYHICTHARHIRYAAML